MRAKTKKKHKMGRRFAILIGVAAVGVMALGAAQTGAAASEGVVEYGTKLSINPDRITHGRTLWHGRAMSNRKCMVGREVILFRKRPGPDRRLGADRTIGAKKPNGGRWGVRAPTAGRVYATVSPKVGDGFVCRGDRSPIYTFG